jgi:IS66 C-terminal element
VLASLIATCKLNTVGLQAYLADVITRIVQGHPNIRLDELLPRVRRPRWPENLAVPNRLGGLRTPARSRHVEASNECRGAMTAQADEPREKIEAVRQTLECQGHDARQRQPLTQPKTRSQKPLTACPKATKRKIPDGRPTKPSGTSKTPV